MLKINTETYLIEITRGDTATIVFSATQDDGTTYEPQLNDVLTFAVAKKVGGEPLMEIKNTYDGNPYTEVEIDSTTFNADKTKYYTKSGSTYTQCQSTDSYNSAETYYVRDFASFWSVFISSGDWLDDSGADKFKFADYVYDVQIETGENVETIIGKTDEINPIFRVWGEVAKEGVV